ncbi:MAG TPA: DEAD/DEAH box helicase, partial [Candidatus Sulfotelmatobacter sp.]|nr:DEAD/DEAH box helicase [Candidatus Sulfotelmatobacter sp.]
SLLSLLPAGAILVVEEKLELERQPDLAEVAARANVLLSAFASPDDESVFAPPQNYVNALENVPPDALIVSRHAQRLQQEYPEFKTVPGELSGGFTAAGRQLLTDRELFGEEPVSRRAKPPAKEGVDGELLADLKVGDYVVHENYGIGLYRGMETLEIEEVKQEYLLIDFADGDKLYVPPHMAGLVEKYVGGKESHPRLSRLGSHEWLKTRTRVKESVKEMTKELLEIYAAREKLAGTAYPPDDVWQKELEATFPYDETPDQLKAIAAVKEDMEAGRPMDRLICGDVGYGKTEVAIRAAAKAAAAGKQVALLAPTTILVEQHYNSFKQRFQDLPYVVEMLSRFRSPAEQKETVRQLAGGGIDIVIGTHRLLSKDVQFKDLGLLILDEEQKFGVAHKEKLKKLKKTVDVLTLSATPIPRTLYFSLAGVREMSTITTPPVDRSPIRTYVIPFSENVIREAVRRELDRGGQVYFVHNFVETIEGMAALIKRVVPEVRVAVGHGQMDEK